MENKSNTVVKPTGTTPDLNEDSALVASLLDPEIKDEFCGVLTTLSAFRQQITMLQNQVRGLEKHVNKKMKTLQREAKKNKNKQDVRCSFSLMRIRSFNISYINLHSKLLR